MSSVRLYFARDSPCDENKQETILNISDQEKDQRTPTVEVEGGFRRRELSYTAKQKRCVGGGECFLTRQNKRILEQEKKIDIDAFVHATDKWLRCTKPMNEKTMERYTRFVCSRAELFQHGDQVQFSSVQFTPLTDWVVRKT